MRDRLRSFDSKITFFAFADIITAVSGMLIFITLLLATDLGRPTDNRAQADAELERQLNETLAQQAEADAANRNLQNLLTDANTAPAPDKLQSDISRLRAELADEKSKHAGLVEELETSRTNLAERDRVLGITAVRERIAAKGREREEITRKESIVRQETAALEGRIPGIEEKILKYRAREGELWLIPDRTGTTKEPVLAIVSGKELQIARFNQPDQTEKFSKSGARSGFKSYLGRIRSDKQYVVFLIRPSGIDLFRDLVDVARDNGFEVGFDPLEEDRQIHFTAPPPIDDQAVPPGRHIDSGGTKTWPSGGGGGPGGGASTRGGNRPGGEAGSDTEVGNPSTEGNPSGGTNLVGGGTSATAGGTNTMEGGTNLVGAGTNIIGGGTNLVGTNQVGTTDGSAASTNSTAQAGKTNSAPASPSPKPKSWWQRLLEWLGIGS